MFYCFVMNMFPKTSCLIGWVVTCQIENLLQRFPVATKAHDKEVQLCHLMVRDSEGSNYCWWHEASMDLHGSIPPQVFPYPKQWTCKVCHLQNVLGCRPWWVEFQKMVCESNWTILNFKKYHHRGTTPPPIEPKSRIFTPWVDKWLKDSVISFATACMVRLTPLASILYSEAGITAMGQRDAIELVRYGEWSEVHRKNAQLSLRQSISSPGLLYWYVFMI